MLLRTARHYIAESLRQHGGGDVVYMGHERHFANLQTLAARWHKGPPLCFLVEKEIYSRDLSLCKLFR